jgi:alpha-glucosidase
MGNHDRHRVASRIGQSQARVANMLLLTLRGTPTTYYGEEIGMENVPIPLELVQDPPAVNQPEIAHVVGRDPVRTPMQWDGSPNAGFAAAGVAPWLPVAGDYAERNVARQEGDPGSTLSLYRALARLRRAEPALHAGEYRSLDAGAEDVFAYLRTAPGADRFLVVLNFGAGSHTLDLGQVGRRATIAVGTDVQRLGRVNLGSLAVDPNEGLVLRVE